MSAPTPDLPRLDADLQMLAMKRAASDRLHAGELAEQRHQLLDLDADSTCPLAGACRYPYLTLGGSA
jgi:hypothetical protein